MFISSLTLKGFKSFADTTVLDLEPGVAVVVGPNGSGKSNVVDAVAWVLGAQGPSALRSQKMDDVIFVGTEERPALGRAEVTLVIDNSQQELPVDVAEVAITRRLFRTGESEYLLNGTECRLGDLQELLSDAGVGRQQHIIVAQGQIEQVLSARPEERRAIVEEAAGILKFRRRKERAERRLDATQVNVTRLADMQREIKRQLRPLQRQAESAKQHERLTQEYEALRLYDTGQQLVSLQNERIKLADQRAEASASIEQKRSEIENLRRTLTSTVDTSDERGQSGSDSSASASPTRSLTRVVGLAERSRGLLGQVYERLRFTQNEKGVVLSQDVAANYAEEQTRLESEMVSLQSQHTKLDAEIQAIRERQEQFSRALEPDQISSDPDHPAHPENQLSKAITATEAELTAAADGLANSASSARELAEELQRWVGRADVLRLSLDEARKRSGIAALKDSVGVLGVLTDLINVQSGKEKAVRAALGETLEAVVVDTPQNAATALAALAEADVAGTVLALRPVASNRSDPLPADSKFTALRDFVTATSLETGEASWNVAGQFDALLDSLLSYAVFTTGDWATAMAGTRDHPRFTFVTDRGDRCGPGGWRIGASPDVATNSALIDAEATIEGLKVELSEATQAQSQAQVKRDELAQRLVEAQQAQQAAVAAEVAADVEQERRLAQEEAMLKERRHAVSQRKSELEHRHKVIVEQLAEHQLNLAAGTQADPNQANKALTPNALRQQRLTKITVGLNALVDRLNTIRQRLSTEQDRLGANEKARQEFARRLGERLNELRQNLTSAELEVDRLEGERSSLEAADSALATKLEMLENSIIEELETDIDTVLAAPAPTLPVDTTAKARLSQLRKELRRLGPVNPLALAEFEELSERFEFVAGQLEDVRQSRRELSQLVRRIDKDIERLFAAAFADVQQNFAKYFETLFPGGSGELLLTEPEDDHNNPIDGGIDLRVRPSGKRVSRLSLLSGGERSLTALAFLFAVFRSRPSPFYVLDEVEASLDEINLNRFLNLLAEFQNEAQILIVTHQQRTMEVADVMYGVSMPPGGSSVVIAERAVSTSQA